MSILIILAQTKTGAMLGITGLLLVAVIIGYLTAYLYSKSVYMKEIKILKEEVERLSGQITLLKDEISKLGESLKEKDDEIEGLKKK